MISKSRATTGSAPDLSLVWFRQDLRVADNAALHAAAKRGRVIPVFIWSPEEEGAWPPGAASRFWLHQSLRVLAESLRGLGSSLVIRRGNSLEQLQSLVEEIGATALYWNRRYEPAVIERDKKIKSHFQSKRIEAQSFNSHLLFEPWTVANKTQNPFRVFTPYWKTCLALAEQNAISEPLAAPRTLPAPKRAPKSLALAELQLEPQRDWAKGIRDAWEPGEKGAQKNLKRFLREVVSNYTETRNRPDLPGTSRLSPHLHFGEIGPRQVWHAIKKEAEAGPGSNQAWRTSQFVAELGWREFAHHLLFYFPQTPAEPMQEKFKQFTWEKNDAWLAAWQRGRTGYPIVDAGMRELWTTGWMHNRVRMIVGSFLIKDLLQPWQLGASWFWDTLADADLASNTLGWQWVAGCGADAAPFFRIFNPVTQGEKFDPNGDYVRRWIPEIARLPDQWIHQPWQAPSGILAQAQVELGQTYPEPIVSHAIAREVALERYAKIKNSSVGGGG